MTDLRCLTHLTELETLTLDDPNYAPTEMARLPNYQTYALLHVPSLKRLDHMLLTEEAKKMAQAVYYHKQM